MKVRELIAELQTLDQDKDIWATNNEGYTYTAPFIHTAEKDFELPAEFEWSEEDKEGYVKKGDYWIG